jgi:hypothetical protein
MGWPVNGDLTIHTLFAANPYLNAPVCRVDLIGDPSALAFTQKPEGLHVILPRTAEAAGLGEIAYVLRIHTHC